MPPDRHAHEALPPARILADQAFSRAAGAPLVPGNNVRLLRDARENLDSPFGWVSRDHRKMLAVDGHLDGDPDPGSATQERERLRVRRDGAGALALPPSDSSRRG